MNTKNARAISSACENGNGIKIGVVPIEIRFNKVMMMMLSYLNWYDSNFYSVSIFPGS